MSLQIREFREEDWPAVWAMLRASNAAGDVFAWSPDTSEEQMRRAWVETTAAVFVASENGQVLGSYFMRPNQTGLGAHVSNAGYVVAPEARGRGIASRMCEHSQAEALAMGFRAMQFNYVVATNEAAVHLWQKHGFAVVGRLPGAYRHLRLGYVEALFMFKQLTP